MTLSNPKFVLRASNSWIFVFYCEIFIKVRSDEPWR